MVIDLEDEIKSRPNIYITPNRPHPESPSREKKRIENKKLEDEWAGCCQKTNKHYLKFVSQIAMGSSVMIFSMVQIARGSDNAEIYFSLLSGTLGLFLPHPQINDE
jgi:hypothetical protein